MSTVPQLPSGNPYMSVRPNPEGVQSNVVHCAGGLVMDVGSLKLSEGMPGAAYNLVNYESALLGGYRKINGYLPFNTNPVPANSFVVGTGPSPTPTANIGPVSGVCVYKQGVIAARNDYIYYATPTGSWTMVNPLDPFTNATEVEFCRYNWASPSLIITNGVTKPYKYDGTTLTQLTNAPTGVRWAVVFSGYLWLAGDTDSIVTVSAPLTENDYNAADGAGQFNVGKKIVGIMPFRDTLYIFCTDALFKITGNAMSAAVTSTPFTLEQVTDDIGCISNNTIQEIGGDLNFLSQDGLRPIAGTNKIGDVQIATISRAVQSYLISHLSDARICSVVIHEKSQLRVFFSNSSVSQPNAMGLIACLTDNGWEFGKLQGIRAYCADSYFLNNVEYVVHGDYDGMVYRQEQGYSFNGQSILSIFQTAPIYFGDPSSRKTVFKLHTYGEYEGKYSITVGTSIDQGKPGIPQPPNIVLTSPYPVISYGTAKYGSGVYGQKPINEAMATIIGSGFTFSLTFTTNDTNPSHTIKSYILEYVMLGRQ